MYQDGIYHSRFGHRSGIHFGQGARPLFRRRLPAFFVVGRGAVRRRDFSLSACRQPLRRIFALLYPSLREVRRGGERSVLSLLFRHADGDVGRNQCAGRKFLALHCRTHGGTLRPDRRQGDRCGRRVESAFRAGDPRLYLRLSVRRRAVFIRRFGGKPGHGYALLPFICLYESVFVGFGDP